MVHARTSHLRTLALIALTGAMAACANVRLAEPQEDARGKRFDPPPPDKGALYVYREGLMGATAAVTVTIAESWKTELAPDTWIRLEGEPASVEVKCLAENSDTRRVEVIAGQTRFVEIAMRIGLTGPRCAVAEMAPDLGQQAVLSGRRAVAQ